MKNKKSKKIVKFSDLNTGKQVVLVIGWASIVSSAISLVMLAAGVNVYENMKNK